jgi:Tfp pilus assembly protein FimV
VCSHISKEVAVVRTRLLLVAAVAAVALVVAPGLARGAGPERPAARVTYTVQPGDTLWSIARRVAPGRDPRPVVDRLIQVNHLGDGLQAGQQLTIVLPG